MVLGFKTGPGNWEVGKRIVTEDGARMCELWFRIDRVGELGFNEMAEWLIEHDVAIGVHYWGLCEGGIRPNIATHHTAVREEALAQMRATIDWTTERGGVYVNIHPGALHLEQVEFDPYRPHLLEDREATSPEVAERNLTDGVLELTAYAQERGTLLTLETLGRAEVVSPDNRDEVYFPGNQGLELNARLAEQGVAVANDLIHTVMAHDYGKREATREEMWEVLRDFTAKTHEATRLVHSNTVLPPFNGSDSHDGVTDAEFAAGVFPSREQVKELLGYFVERDDVYIVPEPRVDMQENYRALVKLAGELSD